MTWIEHYWSVGNSRCSNIIWLNLSHQQLLRCISQWFDNNNNSNNHSNMVGRNCLKNSRQILWRGYYLHFKLLPSKYRLLPMVILTYDYKLSSFSVKKTADTTFGKFLGYMHLIINHCWYHELHYIEWLRRKGYIIFVITNILLNHNFRNLRKHEINPNWGAFYNYLTSSTHVSK